MSQLTVVTSTPSDLRSRAARSSSSSSRAQMTTRQECRPSSRASSRPSPRDAPVTIATSPAMSSGAESRVPTVSPHSRCLATVSYQSHGYPRSAAIHRLVGEGEAVALGRRGQQVEGVFGGPATLSDEDARCPVDDAVGSQGLLQLVSEAGRAPVAAPVGQSHRGAGTEAGGQPLAGGGEAVLVVGVDVQRTQSVSAHHERYRKGGADSLSDGGASELRPALVGRRLVDPQDLLPPVGLQARAAGFRVVLDAVDPPGGIAGGEGSGRSFCLQQGDRTLVSACQ